jgi:fumarate hydratase class II
MSEFRSERDSLGEVLVPAEALYGAQTQRAVDNFPLSGRPMPAAFIRALLLLKRAAAQASGELGELDGRVAKAIVDACETLLESDCSAHFPVDVFQTGSGTSSNMNANEVLATLASRALGMPVSANDHVNRGQSSNDVIPSGIHISSALLLSQKALPGLRELAALLAQKARETRGIVKTGRTHLMDALPVRFDQVLGGWRAQIDADVQRLESMLPQLLTLPIGGTAVGTGVNAPAGFAAAVCASLHAQTGLEFVPAADRFALIGAQDTAVALSGQLRTTAVSLMKIANDLRWMNSGPLAGLAEIELPALQPGSSIMPGKVNPVIPEAVAQIAAQVMGNDASIGIAGQSGNFELNVMLPLIADRQIDSLQLLASASRLLAEKAIRDFRINQPRLDAALARNPMLVTALNPHIGYLAAADIAKQAYAENRAIIDVALERTDLSREKLEELLDPVRLTGEGIVIIPD